MYKEQLDLVISYFTTDAYAAEFAKAREDYFKVTGKVFEDESMYESRITAFLEWYLLDRHLVDVGVPPVRLFYLIHRNKLPKEVISVVEQLQKTNHSLFEVVSRSGDRMNVKDLFDDQTYEILERRTYAGVEKGDLLDSRLIHLDQKTLFSDAMWLHPTEVKKFIVGEAMKAREEGKEQFLKLLFDFAYMKLKKDRYRHIEAEQIYAWSTIRNDRKELSA